MGSTSERPPEQADFAAAPLPAPRRRPRVVALAWVIVLGGVVALGLSGRSTGGSGTSSSPVPTPNVPGAGGDSRSAAFPTGSAFPLPSPISAPVIASKPGGAVSLEIRRQPETLFVHGDVSVSGVTWVFVSVISADGRVAGWSSVSVPGGAPGRSDHRPALRFDVEIAVPDWATTGSLWVQTVAYDGTGKVVGTGRLGVLPDGGPAPS